MNVNLKKPGEKPKVKESGFAGKKKSQKRSMNNHLSSHPFSLLQGKVGNRAVNRLIESRFIQAKLEVGQSGDAYEREADRAAKQVLRMSAVRGEEGRVTHLAKSSLGERQAIEGDLESRINAARVGGKPLPGPARGFFESRFGQDYGMVRVHADSVADNINKEIGARAFTIGNDIFFRNSQYNVQNEQGRFLLAHELAHVAQQNQGASGAHLRNTIMRNNDGVPTEFNLDVVFDEDFDGFRGQIIGLVGERVMHRTLHRDRASYLVRHSNLWDVHQQLLAAHFRTGRRHVVHASFSWSGSRMEAVTFSLRVEHISFGGEHVVGNRQYIFSILNDPRHRAHFEAQYRVMLARAEAWASSRPGLHRAAVRSTQRHAQMGAWIMRNYPRLIVDSNSVLRRWFFVSRELLERRPSESHEEFIQRIRDRVDAYVSAINARYRSNIYDAQYRECGVEGGCSPEGRILSEHMDYLRRTYGRAPW